MEHIGNYVFISEGQLDWVITTEIILTQLLFMYYIYSHVVLMVPTGKEILFSRTLQDKITIFQDKVQDLTVINQDTCMCKKAYA